MESHDLVFGILGLAMPIVGGGFWLVWKQISDTARNLREEMAEVRAYVEERSKEGRDDRTSLWNEVRAIERSAVQNYREVLERLSKVPTRDEFRADFQQFEQRVMRSLDASKPH